MPKEQIKVEGYSAYHADSGKKIELAMQDLRLEGTITELGAVLNIRHLFRSAEKSNVEVVYAFMLPRDAVLKRFKIIGEGFNVTSSLLKTSKAKETYEDGIKKGSLSVLTQQFRDGVVNLTIGNLRPGEQVAVYLEVFSGVDLSDDGFRFRFPFTLAPGYHSKARYDFDGRIGRVLIPDDEFDDVIYPEWWNDASNLHTVSFGLEVSPKSKISGVSSPSHPLDIRLKENSFQVSLSTEKDVPNRDLILDVLIDSSDPRTFFASNPENDDRFVSVIPSKFFNEAEESPRRIVFVLDRSGSMRGAPMTQAKRALKACLGVLSEDDTFGIVAFDDRVEVYRKSLVKGVSGNREEGSNFINRIDARGGTKLLFGIKSAIDILNAEGDIMVLTDGQVLATEEIINQVVHGSLRIHCLGIGSASQDRFLALLSRKTGGISSFISPRERVDLAALTLFSSITSPVAEEIKIRVIGGKSVIRPSPPTTVYHGVPLIIYGTAKGESILSVSWKDSSKELNIPLSKNEKLSYDTLKLIQGARIITDIDSQIYMSNRKDKLSNKRLERKLFETSLKYSLSSRAASLVAVVKRKDDISGMTPRTVIVPVGIPEDVDFSSYMRTSSLNIMSPVNVMDKRSYPITEGTGAISGSPNVSVMGGDAPSLKHIDLEDESDILFELAAKMQPDGGMTGDNHEERIIHSLLMILELNQQPDEVVKAFNIHIDRLMNYIEKQKTHLKTNKLDKISSILDLVRQGKPPKGTWRKYLSKLLTLPKININEIWETLGLK